MYDIIASNVIPKISFEFMQPRHCNKLLQAATDFESRSNANLNSVRMNEVHPFIN